MNRIALLTLSAGIAFSSMSPAVYAQDAPDSAAVAEAPPRPPVRFFNRERENWTVLSERDDDHPFDALKLIEIDDDISLSFGGAARLRFERFENFGFRPQNDDEYLLTHARLHADLRVGSRLRFFVEGQTAWITERDLPGGIRGIDEDQADLTQAWASLTAPLGDSASVEIRGGRHQLNFGAQRLISPLPWANVFRAWDGVVADFKVHDWSITTLWTAFVPTRRFGFNTADSDRHLWGAYASGPIGAGFTTDFYFLGTENNLNRSFNGTTGEEHRRTVGARLSHKKAPGSCDLDLEGAYQFGEIDGRDISAFFVDGEAGYTFAGDWTPRIAIGGGYASGDDNPGGSVQTFDPLFPLGHAYHGFADQIGRQNVAELRSVFEIKPTKKLKLRAGVHAFWRASTDDAVYNAGGGVIRTGASTDERFLGMELDVTGTYVFSPNAVLELGYSRFFASSAFRTASGAPDLDFYYSQLILKF